MNCRTRQSLAFTLSQDKLDRPVPRFISSGAPEEMNLVNMNRAYFSFSLAPILA